MERRTYEFVIQARQPIAHHQETIGNEAIAMRRMVRQPDGGFARVPIITGDTMRHGLREGAAYATLEAAGMLDARLNEGALRLLFAGGTLSGRGDGGTTVKLNRYRELVDLFPPLSLFGGCAENRCIPGRLEVDEALLVCAETAHLVPEWVLRVACGDPAKIGAAGSRKIPSCRAHVESATRVRMDPLLSPEKRLLLTEESSARYEGRLLENESASASGNALKKADTKSSMMPRSFERIAQGSLFYWSVTATTYSELDVSCFHTALASFMGRMKVGGKRGTGHGQLRVLAAQGIEAATPLMAAKAINPEFWAKQGGKAFAAHVAERADALRSWLSGVDA